ncbi:Uncharacterised protein [Streptococcus pneumoniae]|nr:Uncharacterised protein [Streptococcus pneumoniae]VMV75420.1 Uncharacterised protein [Streptococcus pneumoniae]VRC12726.1 Uncharacterised protein [Streptococcus pneumoniae]
MSYIYRTIEVFQVSTLGLHHFLKLSQCLTILKMLANFFNSLVNICQTKHNLSQFTNKVGNILTSLTLQNLQCFKDFQTISNRSSQRLAHIRNHCYCLPSNNLTKIYHSLSQLTRLINRLHEGTLTDSHV